MSEQNKTVVRRYIDEVWTRKNPALIGEFVGSNSEFHTPDGNLRGPEGYKQLFSTYSSAFPDCEIAIENMIAESDRLAIQYTFRGTHKGNLMGIAPTGKQVSVKGTSMIRLAGGKFVEESVVWDTLDLMRQIGAVTLPAKAKGAGAR